MGDDKVKSDVTIDFTVMLEEVRCWNCGLLLGHFAFGIVRMKCRKCHETTTILSKSASERQDQKFPIKSASERLNLIVGGAQNVQKSTA